MRRVDATAYHGRIGPNRLLQRVLALAVAALLSMPAVARPQTVAEQLPAADVTLESVQNRLKQIEESNLDETIKVRIRSFYQQALQDLTSADNWAASAETFEQMVVKAPQELRQAKADLSALPRQPDVAIPQASLVQLEQTLSRKESDLSEKRSFLAQLEVEPKRRAARRVEVPKLSAAARERQADVEKQIQASAASTEAPEAATARRISLLARRRAIEQEVVSYEKELKAYEVRAELLPLRRDLAAGQIALAEQEVAHWREVVNRQRQHDADAQVRRARWEANQAHPGMAELTARNAQLAERRKALAQLIVQTTAQLEDTNKKLAALQDQFKRIQGKVEAVGLTNAIGLLLRKQRVTLPDLADHRRNMSLRQNTIGEWQLELLQSEDRRSELANLEAQIQKELRSIGGADDEADYKELELGTRAALETEKEYLDALIVDANSYFDKLVDLDNAERGLIEQTEAYAKYIDERVLWIRSTPAFGLPPLRHMAQALAWLAEPVAWSAALRSLLVDARNNPVFPALAVLVFGTMIYSLRRVRAKLAAIGATSRRANCSDLTPTLEAILLTTLVAMLWPGLMWYVAWRLGAGVDATEFSKAIAAGLGSVAGVYLVLEIFRQMCRVDGLSEAHFEWPVSALKPMRNYLRATMLLILPPLFIAVVMNSQENERWADSLGRMSFVAVMAVCSLLVQQSLRPAGGIYQAVIAPRRGEWLGRLRLLWHTTAVLAPLALAVLALAGYHYTAEQLARRLVTSAYVLLGLAMLRSFLLRWVLVRRRKLAMQQARQRRAAIQAETRPAGESAVPSVIPMPSEPNLDLATINAQTRHFIEYSLLVAGLAGIWLVWVDVLPALRILDSITLWQMFDQADAITLADLCLAALVSATTLIAAKNIPGLLEMTVLQRLPLDAGFRYTIGAVSRYVIIVVGLVTACHNIGLSWGKVQWLIAAVSVGLGFGLQEIFANFVSGLIILFERPVRVGDVVTVDEVTGVISRIRMRATTITDWDRREFIVPNKEFITGRLLNWTLSDQVNRVVVRVGVAYGSNTTLAAELLMKVAEQHPVVLADPAPKVAFEEFGDSALNFVLRCYLPDMENRLDVIHDLHVEVDREFRQAGIEIAFPQHDVHIRSIDVPAAWLDRVPQAAPAAPRVVREEDDTVTDRRVA